LPFPAIAGRARATTNARAKKITNFLIHSLLVELCKFVQPASLLSYRARGWQQTCPKQLARVNN
jgi:hypothetical protein